MPGEPEIPSLFRNRGKRSEILKTPSPKRNRDKIIHRPAHTPTIPSTGAKAIFADVESPISLAFLRRYPTPAAAAHLRETSGRDAADDGSRRRLPGPGGRQLQRCLPQQVSPLQFTMFQDNPAVRMMQGVPNALHSAGGFTVWDGGWVIQLLLRAAGQTGLGWPGTG